MKKKRAEQVLQTTVSLTLFVLQMSTYIINRNEKKCAKQVLQTTFSLIYGSNFKCPTVISIGIRKKRAEQVLQTTVSFT